MKLSKIQTYHVCLILLYIKYMRRCEPYLFHLTVCVLNKLHTEQKLHEPAVREPELN